MARKPAPQEGRVQFFKDSFRSLLTNSMVGLATCVTFYASAHGYHQYAQQVTTPTLSAFAGWVGENAVNKALGVKTPETLACRAAVLATMTEEDRHPLDVSPKAEVPPPSQQEEPQRESKSTPEDVAVQVAAIRNLNFVEAKKSIEVSTQTPPSYYSFFSQQGSSSGAAIVAEVQVEEQSSKKKEMPAKLTAYLEENSAVGQAVQENADKMRGQLPLAVDQARESGLIDDFASVEAITGFSLTKLLTLSGFESSMGTDPKAGKDVLQVKMPTFLDGLVRYGDTFVQLVRPFRPALADDVACLLPYIKVKNSAFLFDDAGYRRDHKDKPLQVKGMKKPLLKDKVESLRDDRFVAGMFTALRLKDVKEKTRLKYQDDLKATEFIDTMGDGFSRFAHVFGETGVDRAIKYRNKAAKEGFPNESVRAFFKIDDRELTRNVCFKIAGVTHITSEEIDRLVGQEDAPQKRRVVALNALRKGLYNGAVPPSLKL